MASMVLALDIGASNGRGIVGRYSGGILTLEEIYRFSNNYTRLQGGLYWDHMHLYRELLNCLRACKEKGYTPDCIGIDAWSQDYALVNAEGRVIGQPRCYHDPDVAADADSVDAILPQDTLYFHNGQAKISISTLRQLYYDTRHSRESLAQAKWMLFIPYLLSYLLCGEAGYDLTLPPIGEVMDINTRRFSKPIADLLGVADKIPPYRECGSILGYTGSSVYEETGYRALPVACVGGHDTSCAVGAIPQPKDFLFVSSGTWSMYGAVVQQPVLTAQAQRYRLCNSPLSGGRLSLLSGTVGMFVIQQCMLAWRRAGTPFTYADLTEYALTHTSSSKFSFDDIDMSSAEMPSEVARALQKAGFPAPSTPQELYVAFANSLAMRTAEDLTNAERITGKSFPEIYLVGGGSQAAAVNKRIAQYSGKAVVTGLTEAAAAGNALSQLVAVGAVKDYEEAMEVAGRSFQMKQV